MMAEVEGDKASKKLLDNLLKSHALKEVLNKGHASTSSSSITSQPSTSRQSQGTTQKLDLFQLPPLPEEFIRAQELQPWEEPSSDATIFEDRFQDLDGVDIDSAEFKCLPPEIQHEILSELKERRKRLTRHTNLVLPQDSNDFSSFQMTKILKQSHLSNKLEEVRKEMNNQVTGTITKDLGDHTIGTEIQSRRILSDDSLHFILIKGLSNKRKLEEVNRIQEETEMMEEYKEASQGQGGNEGRKTEEKDELVESDTEVDESVRDSKRSEDVECPGVKTDKLKVKHDLGASNSDKSNEKERIPIIEMSDSDQENNQVDKMSSNGEFKVMGNRREVEDSEVTGVEYNTHTSSSREITLVNGVSTPLEVGGIEKTTTVECPRNHSSEDKGNKSYQNESSDSEDEGFIEVSIDPNKVGPDELFPADIFNTRSTSESQKELAPTSDAEPQYVYSPEPEHTTAELESTETNTGEESRDLVQQFTELVESDVNKISEELELESQTLQQERGRQERLATSLSDQMFLEAQDLLRLFGVPYVLSPTEAEAQCAWLDSLNLIHGTITDDSDIWLFGGKRVYKNFFNQDRTVELYLKESIQSQLGLSREILINIALLCGCDYTEGIPGVGPVTAMEILSEFPAADFSSLQAFKSWWEESQKKKRNPNISKVRSKLRRLDVSEGFPDHRIVDAFLKPTVDESEETFSWVLPDLDLLREYAKEKLGWTKDKTDELLLPVFQKLQDTQTQTRINSFFQPENFMEPKKLKSVRLKRALKRFHKEERGSEDRVEESAKEKAKRVKVASELSRRQSTGGGKAKQKLCKNSKPARGKGKGKAPAKKSQTSKKPVYREEVNLSESSSDDIADDDDDDVLANLDYESWQN
ncbi:DNA excision repair protein ERCC-5-like isoform X3 [Ostrea edulis]|nr:DNA excision repair protein ERCC-5-like isoform X3 [Ostrea edulis]